MGNSESAFIADLGENYPPEIKFFRLKNLTNTCYCNSVLQSLLASNHVQRFLEYLDEDMVKHGKRDKTPLDELCEMNRERWKKDAKRVIVIKPQEFLSTVYRQTEQFTRGFQHDAHELFMFLISSFDESSKKLIEQKNPTAAANSSKPKHPTFARLFEGIRVSSFECQTCGHEQQTRETFTSLDIPIIANSDLQELIEESLCPESLDNSWTCDHCKEKREAQIRTHMAQAPPVLLVQLQRFKYDRRTGQMAKLSDVVGIPEELFLNSGTGPQRYRLSSIICHIGASIKSGHFLTLLRVKNMWVLANDDQLSVRSEFEVRQLLMGRGNDPTKALYVPYVLIYEC